MNDAAAKSEKRGKSGWIITAAAIGFLIILGYGLWTKSGSPKSVPRPPILPCPSSMVGSYLCQIGAARWR
ncbi:MAG: hypothetical protein H8E47_10550 [Anaerolineales bacterium]|nr:hypothetical protein [Anaerolineales bacterium]